jgi:hypothetical protein
MPKPMNLTDRSRAAAASCLGLTPTSSPTEIRSALARRASTLNVDSLLTDASSTGDVLIDRQVAAARLLLSDPTDRKAHGRAVTKFFTADAKVPEVRRQFQAPAPRKHSEQILLVS